MSSSSQRDSAVVEVEEAYARLRERVPENYYSPLNHDNLVRVQEIERQIVRALNRRRLTSLHDTTILEIGCGSGRWLRNFIQWGAQPQNLYGVDLLEIMIQNAQKLCPPTVHLDRQDARELRFPDASFDLVFQMVVFTSVLDSHARTAIAKEMIRVLKPGGLIVWYDFFVNNPRNPDVRGVGRSEIRRLFPDCRIKLKRMTVAPPLSHVLFRISPLLRGAVAAIKIFDTHYLGTIERK